MSFIDPLREAYAPGKVLERVALINTRSGLTLATSIEAALDRRSRRHGLLRRASLAEGAGLVLAPCSGIHTFFMRFSIDVLFVTSDGRVVKIRPGLPAWRATIAIGAYAAIELPSGSAAKTDTRVGDRLEIITRRHED